jgi:hypothetical protein
VCEVTRARQRFSTVTGVGASERTASSRAFGSVLLRKILEDLNADFLRDRAFDPAHAIPKPDDFALFLDVHESTSRERLKK